MTQYLIIFAPKSDITVPLFPLAISGIFVLGCELKKKHNFFTNIFMVGGYIALLWVLLLYSNPDENLSLSNKLDVSARNIGWLLMVGTGFAYTVYTAIKSKNGFYFAPIVMCIIMALNLISNEAEIVIKFLLLIFGGLVGIYGIFHASKIKSMLGLNGSVILIVAMILNYFFSADLPIITRGVAFIVLGVGFVVLNLIVTKKFKKLQKEA